MGGRNQELLRQYSRVMKMPIKEVKRRWKKTSPKEKHQIRIEMAEIVAGERDQQAELLTVLGGDE